MSERHLSSAQRTFRFWAAFAVLPLVDALVAFLGFPLVWKTSRPRAGRRRVSPEESLFI